MNQDVLTAFSCTVLIVMGLVRSFTDQPAEAAANWSLACVLLLVNIRARLK